MKPLDALVRGLRRGHDQRAAALHDRASFDAIAARHAAAHEATFNGFADGARIVGRALCSSEPGRLLRLPSTLSHKRSSWVLGATGTGKSRYILSGCIQDLAAGDVGVLLLDWKGESANQFSQVIVPWVAMQLGPARGAELLRGLRVLAPWSTRSLPSLHLTFPGGDVARRSAALVDLFTAAAGAGELGHRQQSLLLPTVRLAMQTNLPFPLIPDVLCRTGLRRALVAAAGDAELTAFFDGRFEVEARETTLGGLLSRIDRFLSDDAVRLALFGADPFDVADWLESGVSVVSLDGAVRVHRLFWSAFIQAALVESILGRRVTPQSRHVVVRVDEAQLGLPTDEQAHALEDALSLMRHRRASLSVIHQHPGQLARYPMLLESLRTNIGVSAVFRCAGEGLAAIRHALPESLPPGVDGAGLPDHRIREAWELALQSLPDRVFVLRAPSIAPSGVVAGTLDLPLEKLAAEVPAEIRAIATEGFGANTRSTLAVRERAWRRTVAELDHVRDVNHDALARDVGVALASRRTRRARSAEVG